MIRHLQYYGTWMSRQERSQVACNPPVSRGEVWLKSTLGGSSRPGIFVVILADKVFTLDRRDFSAYRFRKTGEFKLIPAKL